MFFDGHLFLCATNKYIFFLIEIRSQNILSSKIASVKRLSFTTKYVILIVAMAIVPKRIKSLLANAHNSLISIFQEEIGAKERMSQGM